MNRAARCQLLKRALHNKLAIAQRPALTGMTLVINAFVWYFYAAHILEQAISNITTDYLVSLLLWSIHFIGIALSAIIGAVVSSKTSERTPFLARWIMIGALASLAPTIVNMYDVLTVAFVSCFWGVCLGLGMPSCMGYFTDKTSVENRGSLAGITMLISALGIFLLGIIHVETVLMGSIILSIWRFSGLAILLRNGRNGKTMNNKKENRYVSYRTIIGQRTFILYLVPWILFSLMAYLSTPIKVDILGKGQVGSLEIIEIGLSGVFAIIGGFLSDAVGRKRITIFGFVTLGLGYAIVGMFPEGIGSWYFYTVADAIAWGFFFVVFIVTVWGDLSYGFPSDKYYAAGVLPFFISKFLQLTVEGSIIGTIAPSAIFSFTAFFLFLAVLPLIYAPETLPKKHIRERELKSYIEKAQRAKEKYV
jgi:MFS family permease